MPSPGRKGLHAQRSVANDPSPTPSRPFGRSTSPIEGEVYGLVHLRYGTLLIGEGAIRKLVCVPIFLGERLDARVV